MEQVRRINGRYQLQHKIGQGGMGAIYHTVDHLTGHVVALKKIRWVEQTSALATQQASDLKLALAHEFQVLASLQHPHIIPVLDYGFDKEGTPFFTMPYLSQANDFLTVSATQNKVKKWHLLQQLLQAIVYLHRHQVVHGDLKANNVLVLHDQNGSDLVQVVDFGLSMTDKTNSMTSSRGTPYYLAPEIWLADQYSFASDLFAFGLLAFQLFAHEQTHPFTPFDSFFLDRVLEAEPQWSLLSEHHDIQPLLQKLLSKRPEERPTAIQAFNYLNRLLGNDIYETEEIREGYLQTAKFVGREAEQHQLTRLRQKAKAGECQAALVGGESGVGKSRLVKQVHIEALVDGFFVLRGKGVVESSLPYQLWHDPLRRLCLMADLTPLMASVLHPLLPDLPKLLGSEIESVPELNGRLAQQRLFNTIADLFRQQTQPILLLLEDLQWADDSLELLKWLLQSIHQHPLLILGTYRIEEQPNLSAQLPQMTHIHLERLTNNQIQAICQSILGRDNITPTLIEFLQQQSEGNTFFLIEIIRALAEEAGQLDKIAQMTLPQTVFPAGIASILERRLTLLPETVIALIQLAAVAGRELDPPLIQKLAKEIDIYKEWLPVVTDAGFVSVDSGRWLFAHDKLREGILSQMDTDTKRTLHSQVASALEALYPDTLSQSATLMYHWGIAGHTEKERQYAKQAGYHAQSQYTYQEALTYFNRAEALVPVSDTTTLYDIYMAQERIYALQGALQQQQAKLKQLQTLKAQLPVTLQGKICVRQVAYETERAEYEQALLYAEEMKRLGEISGDQGLISESYLDRGYIFSLIGENEQAQADFQDGWQIAQALDNKLLMARCLQSIAIIYSVPGQYELAIQYDKQALHYYQELKNPFGSATIMNNLGITSMFLRDYVYAESYYRQALTLINQIGDVLFGGLALHNLAGALRVQGYYEEALSYYEQSLSLCQKIHSPMLKNRNDTHMGFLYIDLGDYHQAQQHLESALTIQQKIQYPHAEGRSTQGLAYLFLAQGDLQQAESHYRQAMQLRQKLKEWYFLVEDHAGLARVMQLQGRVDEARQFLDQVLAYLEENPRLDGSESYMRAFHLTWLVLQDFEQYQEADHVLSLAYAVLQDYIDKTPDVTKQKMYLGQTHHHALWQAWQAK